MHLSASRKLLVARFSFNGMLYDVILMPHWGIMTSVARVYLFGLFLFGLTTSVFADTTPKVFFSNLLDGGQVFSPFVVEMGIDGYAVEPAGAPKDGTGHHHIVVDGGFIKEGELIPADEKHLHFGKGQTSATVSLTPGEHKLTLQFADGLHRSYGEKLSATVNVVVK